MQFLVNGYDGTDAEAPARRLAAREAHLELAELLVKNGLQLYGVAIQDDSGKIIGSSIVCEFPSRAELIEWLREEPYVTGGVWEKIEIRRCELFKPKSG